MKPPSLTPVFHGLLVQNHDALEVIARELPRLAEAASDERLKLCLSEYLDQTSEQLRRSETVLNSLHISAKTANNAALQQLVTEALPLVTSDSAAENRDLLLARAVLRVQHCQIASLGVLELLAESLALDEALQFTRDAFNAEVAAEEALCTHLEATVISRAVEAA